MGISDSQRCPFGRIVTLEVLSWNLYDWASLVAVLSALIT